MKNTLKNISIVGLWFALLIGGLFLIALLVNGGASLAVKVNPLLIHVVTIITVIDVLILCPLAIFKKTRGFAGLLIYLSSYLFGLSLWVFSVVLVYGIWGGVALLIGLLFAGVGVLPMAFIAVILHGYWDLLGNLIYATILTFGARLLGNYLVEKPEQEIVDSEVG